MSAQTSLTRAFLKKCVRNICTLHYLYNPVCSNVIHAFYWLPWTFIIFLKLIKTEIKIDNHLLIPWMGFRFLVVFFFFLMAILIWWLRLTCLTCNRAPEYYKSSGVPSFGHICHLISLSQGCHSSLQEQLLNIYQWHLKSYECFQLYCDKKKIIIIIIKTPWFCSLKIVLGHRSDL